MKPYRHQVYRCTCERGYVRCFRQVAKRGGTCDTCQAPHHVDGYHTATITTDARS